MEFGGRVSGSVGLGVSAFSVEWMGRSRNEGLIRIRTFSW